MDQLWWVKDGQEAVLFDGGKWCGVLWRDGADGWAFTSTLGTVHAPTFDECKALAVVTYRMGG